MNKTSVFNSGSFKRFFKTNIILLCLMFYYSQVVYAKVDDIIESAKVDSINVYTGPSASEKVKEESIVANEINGKGIKIKDEAMGGRFLKIEINGKEWWIKARQVKVNYTQKYDVGACEVQNKTTGTRAAVNCTD